MIADITWCGNYQDCKLKNKCKRPVNILMDYLDKSIEVDKTRYRYSQCNFYNENQECENFKQKGE